MSEIAESARGEEAVTCVANRPRDSAFFVAPGDRDGARLEAIMGGEREQRRMEADRIAVTFENGAAKIVIQKDPGAAVPGGECRCMAAQKVLHPRVEEEA